VWRKVYGTVLYLEMHRVGVEREVNWYRFLFGTEMSWCGECS